MLDFNFFIPTEFVFGKGAEMKAAEQLLKRGHKKVLVHYGGGSVKRSGLLDRVVNNLTENGIEVFQLGGVQPNPRISLVREGIRIVRENNIPCVLAIGGGSAIDSAKAICTGVPYDGDCWDFYIGKAKPTAVLDLGVILTIAAAGSESSNSCVINNEDGAFKRGLNSEFNRPKFALCNPELTYTLPAYQTACGATDIMAHIFERYFTNEKEVGMTDRLCEAVLQTVIEAAPKALANPCDYDARAQLMMASTLAHNGICSIGRKEDWACHQLEHELSARYDVAHGAGLAVVFPAWMRYTLPHDPMRFAQLAVRVWGCEMDESNPTATALEGIKRYESFLKSIGMPLSFAELGADEADIPMMAAKARRNNGNFTGSFVPLTTEDIEKIYTIALRK